MIPRLPTPSERCPECGADDWHAHHAYRCECVECGAAAIRPDVRTPWQFVSASTMRAAADAAIMVRDPFDDDDGLDR